MNVIKFYLSLNVSNVNRSIDFYKRAFYATPEERRSDFAELDVQNLRLNLTLRAGAPADGTSGHFGVQVETTNDLAQAWTVFKAAGLETWTEENVPGSAGLLNKVWVKDPDGHAWALSAVKANSSPEEAAAGDDELPDEKTG